jgi:hypothetical protein
LIPDGSVFTNPDYCYSFEFTSFKNRIVTPYDKDELTLLAVFDKKNNVELSWEDASAACPYFARPKRYSCSSINDIKKLIETLGDTEEGFVVLDSHNNRIKCKNPAYLALHHAYSRGGMMGVDRLFELALGVDRQEVISYFPDLVPKLTEVDLFIEEFVKEAEDLWQNNCEQGIWKFANAVKDSRTSSFLFYRFNKDRNADIHKWIREPKNQKILVKDFKRGS